MNKIVDHQFEQFSLTFIQIDNQASRPSDGQASKRETDTTRHNNELTDGILLFCGCKACPKKKVSLFSKLYPNIRFVFGQVALFHGTKARIMLFVLQPKLARKSYSLTDRRTDRRTGTASITMPGRLKDIFKRNVEMETYGVKSKESKETCPESRRKLKMNSRWKSFPKAEI